MNKDEFLVLLTKKLTEGLDQQEQLNYDIYISNHPSYQAVVDELHGFFNSNERSVADPLQELNFKKLSRQLGGPYRKINPYKIVFRAAILLAACVLVVFFWNRWYTSDSATIPSDLVLQEVSSDNANLLFALADGTTVILDKNATLHFNTDFGDRFRVAKLEGNAQFDVTENAAVPMHIDLGLWDVIVKGTTFNILQDKVLGRYELQLFEGKVEVAVKNDPNQVLDIKPGEKVTWMATSKRADDFRVSSMTEGESLEMRRQHRDSLVFKNIPFKTLAVKIQDRYKKRLVFENKKAAQARYTGVIHNIGLDELLKTLRIGYPFEYEIRDTVVVIK